MVRAGAGAGAGKEVSLTAGYKLVPWSSWEQWDFVRENIFSSSSHAVSAALQRISAWRSRGCLPIPIDVTAAFVEIQQQDPYFRQGTDDNGDSVSVAEEMLAMLYSMAIMRLVNGFMENAHKKTGLSISELAEAAGIPRALVDIRHESSHRDLPSVRLVRSASVKAIDWLKANYWEPQKNAIPNIFSEIRTKVHAMLCYIKTGETRRTHKETKVKRVRKPVLLGCNKLSQQIVGKPQSASRQNAGFEKLISKAIKSISKLYMAYPSEVVSVLLEFFKLDDPDFCYSVDDEHLDSYDNDGLEPFFLSFNDLKIIITKLANKEPRLVLSMLKAVIEMIESQQNLKVESSNREKPKPTSESPLTSNLSSLLLWLITTLKVLQETGNMNVISEAAFPSSDKNSVPVFSLTKLLEKLLSLTIFGEKNIVSSTLLLVDMLGGNSVKDKLKKLIFLGSQTGSAEEVTLSRHKSMPPSKHEKSIKKANEEFEYLKLKSKRHNSTGNIDQGDNNAWSVAKSWTPCPIGMVPCPFSSTAVLPSFYTSTTITVLDAKGSGVVSDDERAAALSDDKETTKANEELLNNEKQHKRNIIQHVEEFTENTRAIKKPRLLLHGHEEELSEVKHPMKGMLLVDGAWKKVSEEELNLLHSSIRTFERS